MSPLSLKAIKDVGYEKMTVVQAATLPLILRGYSFFHTFDLFEYLALPVILNYLVVSVSYVFIR